MTKMMTNAYQWVQKPHDDALVGEIINQYGVSRLAACVLQNRHASVTDSIGLDGEALAGLLHNPFLMKDMQRAVSRIDRAITRQEQITVYGDYDADGVTATALLYLFLRSKGANADYYIPSRADEGYGVNTSALDTIAQGGTKLVITVDTGVSASNEIAYAKTLGMDVIVTDHHECGEVVPDCVAVINPKQPDCGYPFPMLAGVGVVFKLICAVDGDLALSESKQYFPLVCIGTVADVVPLVDENRVFAALGMKYIGESGNAGIGALLGELDAKDKKITAGVVAFGIAPRINAAGRLGKADKSAELFICNDRERAGVIARELSEINTLRQNIQQQIYDEAIAYIEENQLQNNKIIVAASPSWHHGIIGIVASKITEHYHRPTILIGIENGVGKGSGRSTHPFNLFEALQSNAAYLTKFGGHSLAAGLTIDAGLIDEFSDAVNTYAKSVSGDSELVPMLTIDALIEGGLPDVGDVRELSLLEPFGMGNPAPVFACMGVTALQVVTMSDGKHLKIAFSDGKKRSEAIGFNMGQLADRIKTGEIIDIAGTLDVCCYKNSESVRFLIRQVNFTMGGAEREVRRA